MSEPGFAHVLAFDCSGSSCSAAVLSDGSVVAERFAAMERGQAETLLPQIKSVMAEAGLRFGDLDAIATTVGPGSFTGLRIGLSAARGLALASGKPIVAFTAFEAFHAARASVDPHRRVVVAIDSRRGPVFAQRFDPEEPAESVERADLPRFLGDGPVLLLGDASGLELPSGVIFVPDRIHAGTIAREAARLGRTGLGRRAATPLYLRPPDVTQPKPRPLP